LPSDANLASEHAQEWSPHVRRRRRDCTCCGFASRPPPPPPRFVRADHYRPRVGPRFLVDGGPLTLYIRRYDGRTPSWQSACVPLLLDRPALLPITVNSEHERRRAARVAKERRRRAVSLPLSRRPVRVHTAAPTIRRVLRALGHPCRVLPRRRRLTVPRRRGPKADH